jgi:4-amino-4-deoxy-L-arabinose transferase-like glycosyltransferase
LLGKRLFGKKAGLYASLFLAFLPAHVFYSGKILNDALATFLIALSFLFFWKGFEENKNPYKVLFGAVLALSLLAKYTTLWIMPAFLIYFLIRRPLKFLKDKYLWYAIIAFLIVLIPWFVYGVYYYGSPIGAFVHGYNSASYWGGVQPWSFYFDQGWLIFSAVGILFIIALAYPLYRKDFFSRKTALILIWVVFFLAMLILMPHKEDRFILPIIPAVCIFIGAVFAELRYQKLIALLAIILLIFSLGSIYYENKSTSNNMNAKCFIETMNYLKSNENDFMTVSESPPLIYYFTHNESAYYPSNLNEDTLKEISSRDKPVYFVFNRFNSGYNNEQGQGLKKLLSGNYINVFSCSLDPEVNFIYASEGS